MVAVVSEAAKPPGAPVCTTIVPLLKKLPVHRMTVPLGTVRVTPLLIKTSVYIAIGSENTSFEETVFASPEPSP